MYKIGALIQARMSSRRLPGKVLAEINGKPLLQYVIESLGQSVSLEHVIVTTSTDLSDESIVSFCEQHQLDCFRGSLDNVVDRFLNACRMYGLHSFVRINADSPLIDHEIIDQALRIYESGNEDLVTNVFPRSYPIGQSVEVIRGSSLEEASRRMTMPEEFEHVTKFYYDNPHVFRVKNFLNFEDLSKLRLVVDTHDDLTRIKIIVNKMNKHHTSYRLRDLVDLYPKI